MKIYESSQVKSMIKTTKSNYGTSLIDIIHLFTSRNFEIRLAGKSARDILMNKIPLKMELASSASLKTMKKLFKRLGVPITVDKNAAIVARYGGQHCTYRITTICPVETLVQPTCAGTIKAYWAVNAYHRTFTIDSLFIDFQGKIYDYFTGYNDFMNSCVRINAHPDTLFRSDYSKIFEYFKLVGSISKPQCGHDRLTLKAICENIKGLDGFSGQQIWSEFKIILMQPNRYECMEAFLACGGSIYLGLPEKLNLFEFREVTCKSNFAKHPLLGISYLCAFMETLEDVMKLHQQLRLSAYERDLAIFLIKNKKATRDINDLVHFRNMCLLPSGNNKQISREYVLELLKYHNKKIIFENLLLMDRPSNPIVPALLRLKKGQLRRIAAKGAANDIFYQSDIEMKEAAVLEMEWSGKKYTSPNKKQKRE